jgi:hypothetical protein
MTVTAQTSLAKVMFLAELRIKSSFSLEKNARVRQNLRKGEQLLMIGNCSSRLPSFLEF